MDGSTPREKGRRGRFSEHAGRNASERRAGLATSHAEADPPLIRGRLPATGDATEDGGDRTQAGRLCRGSGGGMRARGAQEQRGKPCRWRARVNREPARASLGRQGGGEARNTGVLEFRLFRAIWFTFFLTDGRSVSHTHSLANRDADVNGNP